MSFPSVSRIQGVSVFSTYSSLPPAVVFHVGGPWVTTSSVGSVAVTMAGGGANSVSALIVVSAWAAAVSARVGAESGRAAVLSGLGASVLTYCGDDATGAVAVAVSACATVVSADCSFDTMSGGVAGACHGPLGSVAEYHVVPSVSQ